MLVKGTMSEQAHLHSDTQQAVESLRSQARRKEGTGILVGLGSVAAGFAISYAGIYKVEPQLKVAPYDRIITEVAFIGVGILATSAGGLFAKEIRQQAAELDQRATEMSRSLVDAHLTKLPEELASVEQPGLAETHDLLPPIILPPEAVATLPTSTFVPPSSRQ